MLQNCPTLFDPVEVSKAERLIKFGRAGWYSVYGSGAALKVTPYDHDQVIALARSKLLNHSDIKELRDSIDQNPQRKFHQEKYLRLLAILAARLALPVGVFSAEASELVSSHLAVLVKTDENRQFVRMGYPSEPILGEAAASATSILGWSLESSPARVVSLRSDWGGERRLPRRAFDEGVVCVGNGQGD